MEYYAAEKSIELLCFNKESSMWKKKSTQQYIYDMLAFVAKRKRIYK